MEDLRGTHFARDYAINVLSKRKVLKVNASTYFYVERSRFCFCWENQNERRNGEKTTYINIAAALIYARTDIKTYVNIFSIYYLILFYSILANESNIKCCGDARRMTMMIILHHRKRWQSVLWWWKTTPSERKWQLDHLLELRPAISVCICVYIRST